MPFNFLRKTWATGETDQFISDFPSLREAAKYVRLMNQVQSKYSLWLIDEGGVVPWVELEMEVYK